MEKVFNPYEETFRRLDEIDKKIDFILRKLGKVDLSDEFNIVGLKPASKILGYKSTKTLSKKINKERSLLKKDIHYRVSINKKSKRYTFNESALKSIRGQI